MCSTNNKKINHYLTEKLTTVSRREAIKNLKRVFHIEEEEAEKAYNMWRCEWVKSDK